MKIKTSRFGELQVEKKDIIQFTEGILGFEKYKKFFVVDPGDSTLIMWLQSIEDESVAFPIMEPSIFNPEYTFKLLPSELNSIELDDANHAQIYSILTIPNEVVEMSANLKAPIVINRSKSIGRQIVLQDSKLNVRFPMYTQLKKFLNNRTSDDSRRSYTESKQQNAEQSAPHVDNPVQIPTTDKKDELAPAPKKRPTDGPSAH